MTLLLRTLAFLALCSTLLPGQSWHLVESPTHQNLARLDMLSPGDGRAISYDGLILQFDGLDWVIEDSLHNIISRSREEGDSAFAGEGAWGDFYTVRMMNEHQGWIAVNEVDSRSYRLLEYDGRRWRPATANLPLKIRSLDFSSSHTVIAAGEGGAFALTGNGLRMLNLPVSADFRSVHMLSPEHYFIAGENGAILEFHDGWERLYNPRTQLLRDMDFVSFEEGWLVGDQGTILHYLDGKLSAEASPTTENIWAVDMLSARRGFAVGAKGVLLAYEEGEWKQLPTQTEADLHDIEMVGESDGWIVGGRGVILRYGEPDQQNPGIRQPDFLFRDQVYLGTRHLMDLIDDVHGVTAADFNGDGLVDIYTTCERSLNHLLLNDGSGFFRDYTITSGTGGDIESRKGLQKFETGALAADLDRDGDTDLLLCGKRGTTQLLANRGQAIFQNVTEQNQLPQDLNISAGVLGDFYLDGYPDLALVDEFEGLRLFRNQKYLRFAEVNLDTLQLPQTGLRALAAADFTGDHLTDLVLFFQQTGPILLENRSGAGWRSNGAPFAGLTVSAFVNGATVADFDGDGLNDLFLCTEDGRDQLLIWDDAARRFADQTRARGIQPEGRSYTAVATDFDQDGRVDLFVSRFGADLLYLATPGGVFREVAESRVYSKAGYLSGFNTGAAAADVDGDRDPDLVVGNRDFWSSLLENTRRDSAFIHIQPVGVQDTREALGTKIWIWEAGSGRSESGLIAFRELVLSNGYFSQNEGGFLLGIGEAAAVDVQVRFLNGDAFFFSNLARGASLRVDQAGQFTQIFYSTARFIRQFLHTPHIFFEIIKLLLFVLLLLLSVRFIEKRYRWRPTHTVIYVLGVIALYAILAFSLPRDQGLLYHLLPFAMILFALAVLVTVNEPIKKSNERQAEIRRSLQQAGVSLSNAQIADRAVAIFGEALLEIYPFDFVAVYLYQPHGNIFLRKFAGGEKLPSLRSRFHLERREVTTLAGEENPSVDVPGMLLPRLIREGDTTGGAGEILLRPVAKEGELKAVLAAGIPAGADRNNTTALAPPDAETRSMVDFLVPQLANTLTHIRIFRDASERDKLAAIGSFSSGILHNLKNPVDGLRMMIEALYHDMPPGDPRFEYVRELYQGVLHLKNALLHSFEFATRTGGDQAPVDIHTVLGEISGHFANLSYLPVQLEFTGRNFKLMGNAQQLKVALENLISNALEASGVDKTVTVSTEFLAAEELLRIDVRDSGAGIPAEQIDKIFDIFYSTRGQSRGLGLAITREIIRRHGGHIDVKSAPGKGTCMSISLPAVSPIPEVADEPHPDH